MFLVSIFSLFLHLALPAWDASVDLFHAMFGGEALPLEYENVRPHLRSSSNGTRHKDRRGDWRQRFGVHSGVLQGHIDIVDQIVFRAALRRFAADCDIFGIDLVEYGLDGFVEMYEKEQQSLRMQKAADAFWRV
jgi:hypothetical protein